ncbi:MAG: hypothetical protein IJE56_02020, partial [Clostridia bacterium]|nr:hypothetical protein [Clostridia bacterium]
PVADGFDRAMSDDFNTALAIADLYGYFKKAKSLLSAKDGRAVNIINDVKKYYGIIELFRTDASAYLEKYAKAEADPDMQKALELAEKMQNARLQKDYQTADGIRAQIAEMGYQVMITKEGVTVKKA